MLNKLNLGLFEALCFYALPGGSGDSLLRRSKVKGSFELVQVPEESGFERDYVLSMRSTQRITQDHRFSIYRSKFEWSGLGE